MSETPKLARGPDEEESSGATMSTIEEAIDLGGGQTCDIPGVLRELDKAGYVIVPKSLIRAYDEYVALLAKGERNTFGLAYARGCRTPKEAVREKIAKLKNKVPL